MSEQKQADISNNDEKEDGTKKKEDKPEVLAARATLAANFKKFKLGDTKVKNDLIKRDIIKKPGLHNADNLNRQIKSNKLKKNLSKSPSKQKELEDSGIIKHSKLPNTLIAAATSLENAQKVDALKQSIGKRSDTDKLYKQGILQNKGIANSLQRTANQLETAQKTDAIRNFVKKSLSKQKDLIPFVAQSINIKGNNKEEIINQILKLLPLLIGNNHPNNIKYNITTNANFEKYAHSNLLFEIVADKKQYLLRIYGTDSTLINRENDKFISATLGVKGLGPKIFASFNNGRIEEFYPNSIVIDPLYGLDNDLKYNKISKQLSMFHSIKITDELKENNLEFDSFWIRVKRWYNITKAFNLQSYKGNNNKFKIWQKIGWNDYMIKLTEYIEAIAPIYENYGIKNGQKNAEKVMKFYYGKDINYESNRDLYLEYITRSFFYEMVLSHNDVYVGNILYLTDLKEIKLIDFEYTSHNFRGFDLGVLIGYSLCPRTQFEGKNHIMIENERKKYINFYLTQFINNKQYEFGDIFKNKKEWESILEICDFIISEFVIICTYHWGLWMVMQSVFGNNDLVSFIDYGYSRLHTQIKCFQQLWHQQYDKRIMKYASKPNDKIKELNGNDDEKKNDK